MFRAFYIQPFETLMVSLSDKGHDMATTVGDITTLKKGGTIVGYNIANITIIGFVLKPGLQTDEQKIINILDKLGINVSVKSFAKFVVGYVISKEKHPNADKLSVCQVDVGDEVLQIVCGAKNVAEGQKVPVALVGATMPNGFYIKKAKLRGVSSMGMICSKRELNLPQDEDGIWVMDDSLEIGSKVI